MPVSYPNTMPMPVYPTADALIAMAHKEKLSFNESMVHKPIPRVPWEELVGEKSEAFATPDALDLLDRMLV
jgi:hypothetical protein